LRAANFLALGLICQIIIGIDPGFLFGLPGQRSTMRGFCLAALVSVLAQAAEVPPLSTSHKQSPLASLAASHGAVSQKAQRLGALRVEGGHTAGQVHFHVSDRHTTLLESNRALPWIKTGATAAKVPSLEDHAVQVLNLGKHAKAGLAGPAPVPAPAAVEATKPKDAIQEYTESASASAERSLKHLADAKAALEKTTDLAEDIHSTGKKIEKTANTIGYLYSTTVPPAAETTKPALKAGAVGNSVVFTLLFCSVAGFVQ